MNPHSVRAKQARRILIEDALENIDLDLTFQKFYLRVYQVFASLGLTLEKEIRDFFTLKEWQEPEHTHELMDQIKAYLKKYIK